MAEFERINKYLARCGLGSRRQCEELVRQGRVSVDSEPVVDLATRVAPNAQVAVDGRRVGAEKRIVFAFHKPAGLLCTADDPDHRQTIYDALPARMRSLHYVGRLDRDSEGLMLLTNDGELTQQLAHPRHEIDKEYLVTLDRAFDPTDRPTLLQGVRIPEGLARAAQIEVVSPRRLRVILRQGLKRQIRSMFDALGYRVKRLVRLRIGRCELGPLKPGRWRQLDERQVADLLVPVVARAGSNSRPARPKPAKTAPKDSPGKATRRPTRNSHLKNRKAGAKRWKRH